MNAFDFFLLCGIVSYLILQIPAVKDIIGTK